MITKTCYFYNVGTTFNKDDLESLKDVWNCNSCCCKSDLCNGLCCEDYGIVFNKKRATKYIEEYVKDGVVNTYGFIKSVDITLPEEEWKDIYQYLVENYGFQSLDDASNRGFISFDYGEIIEDFSSYCEEPDESFFKSDLNTIEKNKIHIFKEEDLNPETIAWVNKHLYGTVKDLEEMEI